MFGFGKKKEEKPQGTESKQFKELAAQFQPEERTILAVTGADSFGWSQTQDGGLWTATMGLTAWMEEDSPDIHQGEFGLVAIGDEQLLEYLRSRMPRDFIVKFKGRVSEDGQRLLLLNLPEPGFDPDLKAILEEQKIPVTFEEEGLGTFELNRVVNWYETRLDWLGMETILVFKKEEDRAKCVENARTLLVSAADWDKRVKEYAADHLLDKANKWNEEENYTRESFMAQMEPESIEIRADGGFQFWFSCGMLFYPDSVVVTGSLEHGPDGASVEG